jgi:TRAP-type C4-dicarboxylate transport system permease small subunit
VKPLRQLRELLVLLETWLAAASLLLLLVLAMLQIVERNLFDSGNAAADTLTRYLVLYVTFFGAALAVDADRHIKIDLCSSFLSASSLARLYRPLCAIGAIICVQFSLAAVRYWRDEWLYAQEQERWLVLVGLVIPIGFGLLSLQFLLAVLFGKDHK